MNKHPQQPKPKLWQRQEQHRQQGLQLLEQGRAPQDVARTVGVATTTVYNWKKRPAGQAGQIQKSGVKSGLTSEQAQHLLGLLEEGPVAHGFQGELWTGRRIAQLIQEHFGIHYHFKSIPALLARLGWSWQKPERRARERDEAAVARWITEEWPRIKKKPTN